MNNDVDRVSSIWVTIILIQRVDFFAIIWYNTIKLYKELKEDDRIF